MKKNKGIVLMLVLAMLLSTFGTVFAAGPTTNDRVNKLIEMGLVLGDANGYRLSDSITRAEVVTMLVRLQGKEDIASTMKTMQSPFKDVTPDHWANGNINYAAAVGLITGYPDGTFRPNAQISYAEVVAMLVRVAGDLTEAEKANAIWPTSYVIKAASLGILDTVTIPGYQDLAVREKMFEMVFNASKVAPAIKTVGNPVEALVIENERIGKMDANTVEVLVLKDQYISKDEGVKAGEKFAIDLSTIYFDGDKIDSEEALGKVFTVYFGEKGTPVKVELNTSYSYIEGLLEDATSNKITIEEKSYDVSTDSEERLDRVLSLSVYNSDDIRYSGASGFTSKVNYNEFVRATIKNGNVIFVEAFDFSDIAPVSEIKTDSIYYVDNQRSGAERTLSLKDKDVVVLGFDGSFSKTELKNIKVNDVIHWFVDGDDVVIVAVDSSKTKISGIFKGISFKNKSDVKPVLEIGKEEVPAYVANGSFSPVYSTIADGSKYYTLTSSYVNELEGFYNKEVTAYVDMFGNLQKLVGGEESEVRFVAVITDVFYKEFELAFGNGTIEEYETSRSTKYYKTVAGNLVSASSSDFDEADMVRVLADGNVIVEMEKLTDSEATITNITKNIVDFGGGEYFYIDNNTTLFVLDMSDVKKSETMSVASFIDKVDTTKTIKGYVVADERDEDVADHVIITEYSKKRAVDTIEEIVKVTRIRAKGADYLLTVETEDGDSTVYLVEDNAEVLKIKNNQVKVGDIIEIVTDEDTEEFIELTVLLNETSPVFYVDAVGRGGARNLNYVVLKGTTGSTKTVWVATASDIFGNYDEGSYVQIGEVDAYNIINLIKVVDSKTITGTWATTDELVVAEFSAMMAVLPTASAITLADKADVVEARAFYTDMTQAQKDAVAVGDFNKLVALEAKIVELEEKAADAAAVKEFADAVALIPTPVTVETVELVEDARAIYDGLTSEQQGQVTLADYNKLIQAEAEAAAL